MPRTPAGGRRNSRWACPGTRRSALPCGRHRSRPSHAHRPGAGAWCRGPVGHASVQPSRRACGTARRPGPPALVCVEVAVGATRADVRELRLLVAVLAGDQGVVAFQREAGFRMVEGGGLRIDHPVLLAVAQAAIELHVPVRIGRRRGGHGHGRSLRVDLDGSRRLRLRVVLRGGVGRRRRRRRQQRQHAERRAEEGDPESEPVHDCPFWGTGGFTWQALHSTGSPL